MFEDGILYSTIKQKLYFYSQLEYCKYRAGCVGPRHEISIEETMCWFQQKYEITLCGKYISVSIQKANKKVFNEMLKK